LDIDLSALTAAKPVIFRKVSLKVASIVKNAGDLDHAIVAPAV
jgi:hypothetical protein